MFRLLFPYVQVQALICLAAGLHMPGRELPYVRSRAFDMPRPFLLRSCLFVVAHTANGAGGGFYIVHIELGFKYMEKRDAVMNMQDVHAVV